jgi:hypothetical protein
MKKFINLKTLFLLAVITLSGYEATVGSGKNLLEKYLPDLPKITWINPLKLNTVQKSSKISIKATIKSPVGIKSVLLYLNDVVYGQPEMTPSLTETGSYIISKSMSFEPGENSIYIVATSSEGSTTSEKRFIAIPIPVQKSDSAATSLPVLSDVPTIIWTSPTGINSTLKSTKTSIKATVRSTIGIKLVLLYLNNVVYGEPEMVPSLTETGSYIISKSLNLEPGENSLYIVATNTKGSSTSEKRYITIPVPNNKTDSAAVSLPVTPMITWTSPSGTNNVSKSTKATIKATVRSTIGLKSVLVYLNDVAYGEPEMIPSLTETGSYIISKTINFESGENSIYIVATNTKGSTSSEKRNFILQVPEKRNDSIAAPLPAAVPPSVTWAVPAVKSTTLKSSSVNIKVSIKSASALKSTMLFLNNVSLGETEIKPVQNEANSYILEKTIDLKQVENNIYVEASNNGGDTRSEVRYFICPLSSLLANQSSKMIEPKTSNIVTATTQVAPVTVAPEPPSSAPATSVAVTSVPASSTPAAPLITWTSPSGSRTTLESFTATVKANIRSNAGLKSVLLYLNGISKGEVEIKPSTENNGSYLIEKNINFGPGENNLYLVATNSEGATKSEVRYFSNPSAVVPAITWSNPATLNSLVNIESFNISACIKSPTELRSVKLLVNGNIQVEDEVFQASDNGDCNYSWKGSVVLKEGNNSVFIIATNIAGSTTSEKRVIKLTPAITEKRLALVFGNSRYNNKTPLKNPENDANLMEGTLKELGFDVIKRLNAGKNEMMAAIREFNEKLPNYNVALFYYAGHGNQVDGKNYLIPTDAILDKPGDCKYEAIDVSFIVDEFEQYQENTNIVILDACRSNPFTSWSRGGDAGFKTMNFTSGTIVAFATSEGATAADGKGSNGLYTEELVKQMAVSQPVSSVFMNTRVQVRKLSNNQQVPSEVNKLNGDFFFKK